MNNSVVEIRIFLTVKIIVDAGKPRGVGVHVERLRKEPRQCVGMAEPIHELHV